MCWQYEELNVLVNSKMTPCVLVFKFFVAQDSVLKPNSRSSFYYWVFTAKTFFIFLRTIYTLKISYILEQSLTWCAT